ncbi:MAG TPA: AcvB/VirJ family lysyl-phosphatidylglycerol hydrolase [Gammaproteobacteria bacterium]
MLSLRLLLPLLCAIALSAPAHGTEATLAVPRFGTVHLYQPATAPKHVALFISGDGGWNLGVVGMARALTELQTLVVGIDINHYLQSLARSNSRCDYAAADFEALSQQVQQKLGLPDYEKPVLVGYSSGATLAYAVAVEAPPGTFRGALSLGFTSDLPLQRPLCAGNGLRHVPLAKGVGINFLPAPELQTPWLVLQGDIDQVAYPRQTQAFAAQIPAARVIVLPKVGHGFSVERHWRPQFREAFLQLAEQGGEQAPSPDNPLHELPLVEVPAAAQAPASDLLAILLTGDGGWAGLDRGMAGEFARAGVPVVGLNSLRYFWKPRDATTTASDVARIARHYLAAWHKQRLLLIGYSFGANVLPFVVERLPVDLRQRVALVALLGPEPNATFEFHLSEWMGGLFAHDGEPILPVLERLHGVPPMLCIHGSEEAHSLCRGLDAALATSIELKGAHHFDGDFAGLARLILHALQR